MKIRIIDTGYCESFENVAIKGGAFKKIRFPSMVAVLQHPEHGVILFDTGYSERILEATKKFPTRIYNWLLPPITLPEQSVKAQLEQMGIDAGEVNYVIVSHFHGDHTSGLKDFYNATYICSKAAFDHLDTISNSFMELKSSVFMDLIPEDLEQRIWLYDADPDIARKRDKDLGILCDLFGDGSLLLVELPGHMEGQIGAIVNTDDEETYFLVADACWLSRSYQENKMPSVIARFIIGNYRAFKKTLLRIHRYHQNNPEVHIIPTHCEKTVEHYVAKTENY